MQRVSVKCFSLAARKSENKNEKLFLHQRLRSVKALNLHADAVDALLSDAIFIPLNN